MNYRLNVTSHTWNKDSNLLFDYESSDYTITNMTLSSSGVFLKNDKKFVFSEKIDKKIENYMGSLNLKGDEFNLRYDEDLEVDRNSKTLDDKMWIVIKNTNFKENEGYRLRDGDIIKLGKVIFKVKEIKVDQKTRIKSKDKNTYSKNNPNNNLIKDRTIADIRNIQLSNRNQIEFMQQDVNTNSNKNLINQSDVPKGKRRKAIVPQCRICLMEDNDILNPLINPCSCIGSVRFIHVECIRKWLKSKITSKMFNFLIVHSFKNLECELCKKAFPERIKFKDEIINIYEMQKPENNYIMLESISREKRENRYLYIIHLKDKQSIKLGRANDSDVRMTDISVSRNHASLKLYNGYLYLQDNSSKFGTLVHLQKDVLIVPQRQIAIQSGKLFLLINIKKTCFAAIRCYKNKTLMDVDYNDYLENQMINYKPEENDYVNLTYNSMTEYELESLSNTIKNSKKNVDEENQLQHLDIFKIEPSPGAFDDAAGIELREMSRDNLFTSVNIKQSDQYRNQANLTDISIHRYVNTDNNLNLNQENDINMNLNHNNNVLTTAYFNLNTSQANLKNFKKTQTDNNINNSINKSNMNLNTNNNLIRESYSLCLENEERLLLRGKTDELPKMKKRIPMKTLKRPDLKLNIQNVDFLSEKIMIQPSNTGKNKHNSIKRDNYNYLGTSDSMISPRISKITIPYSATNPLQNSEKYEITHKNNIPTYKQTKKFNSEIISENDRSNLMFQNISKISREGLLNNSNFLLEDRRISIRELREENFNSEKKIPNDLQILNCNNSNYDEIIDYKLDENILKRVNEKSIINKSKDETDSEKIKSVINKNEKEIKPKFNKVNSLEINHSKANYYSLGNFSTRNNGILNFQEKVEEIKKNELIFSPSKIEEVDFFNDKTKDNNFPKEINFENTGNLIEMTDPEQNQIRSRGNKINYSSSSNIFSNKPNLLDFEEVDNVNYRNSEDNEIITNERNLNLDLQEENCNTEEKKEIDPSPKTEENVLNVSDSNSVNLEENNPGNLKISQNIAKEKNYPIEKFDKIKDFEFYEKKDSFERPIKINYKDGSIKDLLENIFGSDCEKSKSNTVTYSEDNRHAKKIRIFYDDIDNDKNDKLMDKNVFQFDDKNNIPDFGDKNNEVLDPVILEKENFSIFTNEEVGRENDRIVSLENNKYNKENS